MLNKIVGTKIILKQSLTPRAVKKIVRFCDDCQQEKDDFFAEQGKNILSSEDITEENYNDQFGKICHSCHIGIGGYWYECVYCHCLENAEYSHMCDEIRAAYENDPDLMGFDDWQIFTWDENPIPD